MRWLRRVVFAGVVVCAGGVAPAQGRGAAVRLKREPKSLDETMVWLRESVAATGGFALGADRLRYEFAGQDVCRLSWRAAAAGDADLLELYPGVEQVEELKEIVPETVRVLPVDVKDLLEGGTGAASAGEAGVYWKITASYVDGRKLPEEPFGFVFADRETAQRVAEVLERGVGECRDGKAPAAVESEVGCDASPTLKVKIEDGPVLSDVTEGRAVRGRIVNHAGEAVSCVVEAVYYAPKGASIEHNINVSDIWVRNVYLRFDLAKGQSVLGQFDLPEFVDATLRAFHFECFPQGAVNVQQHACVELRKPIPLVVGKMGLERK